jgi:hypothetical protein
MKQISCAASQPMEQFSGTEKKPSATPATYFPNRTGAPPT